jgi:hypothetical protein
MTQSPLQSTVQCTAGVQKYHTRYLQTRNKENLGRLVKAVLRILNGLMRNFLFSGTVLIPQYVLLMLIL